MIIFQANDNMKAIYQKTIRVMEQNVEWNGTFMISNNTLILPGTLKSLFFNFDDKRAMGSVVDEQVPEQILDMKDNPTLESAINMSLYVFGKWGKIRGLAVDKSYDQLTALVNGVFADINVTAHITGDYCRFYQEDMKLTYEEVLEQLYEYLFPISNDANEEDEEGSQEHAGGEDKEDAMTKMGLWHKLLWKSADVTFQKKEITEQERNTKRIGKGFYRTNYLCPGCGESMYMVVYASSAEFQIDTDAGAIITTRNYTCQTCHRFYTAYPFRMLADGKVFVMDFDDDEDAYEDYRELVGSDGARVMNGGFNRFADEEKNKMYQDGSLPELRRQRRVYDLIEIDPSELSDEELMELMDLYEERMFPEEMDEKSAEIRVSKMNHQKKIRRLSDKYVALDTAPKQTESSHEESVIEEKQTEEKKIAEKTERQTVEKSEATKPEVARSEQGKKETGKSETTKSETTKSETTKSETTKAETTKSEHAQKEPQTPFYSRRSKVVVARRYMEAGDVSSFEERIKDMDEDDLSELAKELETTKHAKEQACGDSVAVQTFTNMAMEQLSKVQQKNMLDLAMSAKQMSFQEMKKVFDMLKNKKCLQTLSEFRRQILENVKGFMQSQGEKELRSLLSHVPEVITKEQYEQFKKKIHEYDNIENQEYLHKLEEKLDQSETSILKSFMEKYKKNMGNRNTLSSLIDKIKSGGFKKSNSDPFVEELQEKIRYLDELVLDKLVPDVMDLTFEEGMEAYRKISQGQFLPELKTEYLTRITKRLENLKKDECRSLVNKLMKDTGIQSSLPEGIHTYDVRKMDAAEDEGAEKDADTIIMSNAINTYIQSEQFEYPLFIYDSTKNDTGELGFALTPDRLYYNTRMNAGAIPVADLHSLYVEGGLFGKGIHVKYTNGQEMKICGNVKDKDGFQKFAARLTEFIKYLKEKPESRNINYMAQERHEKKCCYRCGFTFSEGNICPKCGGKNR